MLVALMVGAFAVQDPDDIRARLDALRKEFLNRAARIFDEESGGAARQLERQLAEVRKEIGAVEARLLELRWEVRDAALVEEVRKQGLPPGQLAVLFRQGTAAHQQGKYAEAIAAYKKLFYSNPATQTGILSAYNVACAYSMDGKKQEALEWVRITTGRGYLDLGRCASGCHETKLDHLQGDTDFDKLKDSPEWKSLLEEFRARIRK